ncbi:hypothetical protein [Microbacterium sp. SSM24]|uniref:hypothetical protein n=1 Tax=Microbacterium sp. SSM24 TaxID=2991714 RepID=UPI002226069C|nr:hypothetical protein [Microbacterium sp. SSM24]MCW3492263.1 hypothetical protein [Microbacterium sp. SSM24]
MSSARDHRTVAVARPTAAGQSAHVDAAELADLLSRVLAVLQEWSIEHGRAATPPARLLSQLASMVAAYELLQTSERERR